MISIPAIEPAISTLPVKNQLIAKVSRVPRVRQLMALRTDLECVSAPRNKTTGALPLLLALSLPCGDSRPLCGCHAAGAKPPAIAHARQLVNSLIWLSNCFPDAPPAFPPGKRAIEGAAAKAISGWGLRNACGERHVVCLENAEKWLISILCRRAERLPIGRQLET